ncbi:hypothetical protein [Acinetobacter sp. YH12120]|uniref:hypothetical protein n=1 Tax=Acinetobacter sp. YH12120 TaxID=2601107 RepID=UPI0015D0FACD|nr:hypothetical protein [Acinetobacter sp. YH12120]
MDLQKDFLNMQIAYEKNCAIRCNCSYEELKAQLDRSESLFGTRYLEGSPRHENWLLWVEAWQAAKAQAIPNGFTVVPIEITPKQIEAYMKGKVFPASMGEHRKFVERLSKDYKAMIEAAQE